MVALRVGRRVALRPGAFRAYHAIVRLVALCLLLCARVAAAQPLPEAPAPEPTPPVEVPVSPAVPVPASSIDARTDPAWALYHELFEAVARDNRVRTRALVAQLFHDHPNHPATTLVRKSSLREPAPITPVDRVERPSRGARAELALFQTLHGMFVGGEICVLVECDEATLVVGLVLAGAALGTVVSLNVPEPTSGQRALVNGGTMWGALNAGLILIATEPDEGKTIAGGMLLGQAIGTGAGVLIGTKRPTAGQVALANSGGQWSLALTGMTIAASEADLSSEQLATVLLIATDAGLVLGSYLAYRMPNVSRAQTLVIDAGGIVGAVGGGSLAIVLSGDANDRATPLGAAIGTVAGLAAAAWFTRNWTTDTDRGSTTLQTYVAPVERGRGGVVGLGMRW